MWGGHSSKCVRLKAFLVLICISCHYNWPYPTKNFQCRWSSFTCIVCELYVQLFVGGACCPETDTANWIVFVRDSLVVMRPRGHQNDCSFSRMMDPAASYIGWEGSLLRNLVRFTPRNGVIEWALQSNIKQVCATTDWLIGTHASLFQIHNYREAYTRGRVAFLTYHLHLDGPPEQSSMQLLLNLKIPCILNRWYNFGVHWEIYGKIWSLRFVLFCCLTIDLYCRYTTLRKKKLNFTSSFCYMWCMVYSVMHGVMYVVYSVRCVVYSVVLPLYGVHT